MKFVKFKKHYFPILKDLFEQYPELNSVQYFKSPHFNEYARVYNIKSINTYKFDVPTIDFKNFIHDMKIDNQSFIQEMMFELKIKSEKEFDIFINTLIDINTHIFSHQKKIDLTREFIDNEINLLEQIWINPKK